MKIKIQCPNCRIDVHTDIVGAEIQERLCPSCSKPFKIGGVFIADTDTKVVEQTLDFIVRVYNNPYKYIDPEEKLKVPYEFKIHIDIWWCLILTAFAGFVIYTIWGKP